MANAFERIKQSKSVTGARCLRSTDESAPSAPSA